VVLDSVIVSPFLGLPEVTDTDDSHAPESSGVPICLTPVSCGGLAPAGLSGRCPAGAWNGGLRSAIVQASLPQLDELDRQAQELDEDAGNDERHAVLLACRGR
jgi:hypothetical protein